MREKIIRELQFITGIVTDDYEYLLCLLLKNGVLYDVSKESTEKAEKIVEEVDDWFAKI